MCIRDSGITDEEDRWMFLNWAKHGDQLSTGRLESDIEDELREDFVDQVRDEF